eukprot:scaffold14017_cov127-Isochrysis_galbana.AAC.2
MRLLLAKDRPSTLDHEGSDQPARRPKMLRKCFIQSQISLKKNSTATLRSPSAGPAQSPAQGAGSSGPCTLHPAEHPRLRRSFPS